MKYLYCVEGFYSRGAYGPINTSVNVVAETVLEAVRKFEEYIQEKNGADSITATLVSRTNRVHVI